MTVRISYVRNRCLKLKTQMIVIKYDGEGYYV